MLRHLKNRQFVILAAAAALSIFLCACSQPGGLSFGEGLPAFGSSGDPIPANPDSSMPPGADQTPEETVLPEPPDIVQDTIPPTFSPAPAPTPVPPPTAIPFGEAVDGPQLPLREAVDDEFFDDAVFVGNSLVEGFGMYSGLKGCDVYASTSMSIFGIDSAYTIALDNGGAGTILQALGQKAYGKVYILLGINEIGMDVDYFKTLYGAFVDSILELQQEADIYIMSLTPVTAAKSAAGTTFSMDRIRTYNERLLSLAEEKECYYVDLCQALSDETGFLPDHATTDGVHFTSGHYTVWLDYLKEHYA